MSHIICILKYHLTDFRWGNGVRTAYNIFIEQIPPGSPLNKSLQESPSSPPTRPHPLHHPPTSPTHTPPLPAPQPPPSSPIGSSFAYRVLARFWGDSAPHRIVGSAHEASGEPANPRPPHDTRFLPGSCSRLQSPWRRNTQRGLPDIGLGDVLHESTYVWGSG